LDHDHHRGPVAGLVAGCERQHPPVFFKAAQPESTEGVILTPAARDQNDFTDPATDH
jgi:hypothetical protein